MASFQIGETKPYRAYNGHTMVAPIYTTDRPDARPFEISAYAYCVETCAACGGGDRKEWFCGEVESDEDWADDVRGSDYVDW